jgi:hypothetical protein
LEAFLDGPAQAGDAGQFGQLRAGGREDDVIPAAEGSDSLGIPFLRWV